MAERTDAPRPNPKAIGEISEAIVLARLIELGYAVSIPFGNNQRYDMIVDDGGIMVRVQVKTGRLYRGSIVFPTCSTNGFTGERRNYLGEADDFIVYCPQTDEVYRVPVAECGPTKTAMLRVDPPASEKQRRLRWAHEHILSQSSRWSRLKPLAACGDAHPDTPPRIVEKVDGQGQRRRHCKECNAAWERRRRDRARSLSAATGAD